MFHFLFFTSNNVVMKQIQAGIIVDMFRLTDNVMIYRTQHQCSDIQILLDVIVPKAIVSAQNSIIDMSEDLARSTHSDRRLFLERLHNLYASTRCMHKIQCELRSTEYFSHVINQGYKLMNILLSADPDAKVFKYCLYLTK